MLKNNQGFSLLEVLIFVSIISVFFIVAAAVATLSLRNVKSNENKILGVRYAEELLEWVRGEKEADWETFTTDRMGQWCFYQTPILGWASNGPCTGNQLINALFKRDLDLQLSGERVNVNITVQWVEGTQTLSVPIKTVFERFE